MKRTLLTILLTIFLLLSINFSLRAGKFCGYYVTNNLDTINCCFNIGDIDYYDFSKITKSVSLVDSESAKNFKPNEIICFVIILSEQEKYKFVSLKGDMKQFYHEIVKGKISLYITYSINLYHGVPSIVPMALKNNIFINLNVLNKKQIVSDLLKDNPAILAKWKKTRVNVWTEPIYDTTEVEKIFREYNEAYLSSE